MNERGIDSILKEHNFFDGMSAEQLHLLSGCGRHVSFGADQHLCRVGDPADCFYVLREGLVSIEVEAPPLDLVSIQTVPAGGVLGWSWLFEPYQWRFDARAIEAVEAIALDGRCIRGKLAGDTGLASELMHRFCAIMVERLEATRLQLIDSSAGGYPLRASLGSQRVDLRGLRR